jgi:seryl-tRNA synthetase
MKLNEIKFGEVIAALAFCGAGVGVYTSLYAEIKDAKTEIANIKKSEQDARAVQEINRKEARDDLKDVKQDVRDVKQDVQKILFELQRSNRREPR